MPIVSKPITVDGTDFPSQREAARTYGFQSGASLLKHIQDALAANCTVAELIAAKYFCHQMDGVLYTSHSKLARALKIGTKRFAELMASTDSIEAAVAAAKAIPKVPLAIPVTINGVRYRSVKGKGSAEESLGITDTTLHRYIERSKTTGESLDALVSGYKAPNKPGTYLVEGRTYCSINALARAFEQPPCRVAARLKEGLTAEEAVRAPRKRNRLPMTHRQRRVVAFDVSYTSLTAAANAFGISPCAVLRRMKRGLTLEEALSTPLTSGTPITVMVGDIRFSSKAKALKHLGLSDSQGPQAIADKLIVPIAPSPASRKPVGPLAKAGDAAEGTV